jgi:hypothetical protein
MKVESEVKKRRGSKNGRAALEDAVRIIQSAREKNKWRAGDSYTLYHYQIREAYEAIAMRYKKGENQRSILASAFYYTDMLNFDPDLSLDDIHPDCVGGATYLCAMNFAMWLEKNEL